MADDDVETVWLDDRQTEAAVHVAKALRAGDVALSVNSAGGDGATAYLTPDQARSIAAALSDAADKADNVGIGPDGD